MPVLQHYGRNMSAPQADKDEVDSRISNLTTHPKALEQQEDIISQTVDGRR